MNSLCSHETSELGQLQLFAKLSLLIGDNCMNSIKTNDPKTKEITNIKAVSTRDENILSAYLVLRIFHCLFFVFWWQK
jgi:hypothetical protein